MPEEDLSIARDFKRPMEGSLEWSNNSVLEMMEHYSHSPFILPSVH